MAYERRSQTGLQKGGSVYVFIETAYGVHQDQILGGQNWAKNQSFDIVAKTAAPADPAQMNAMLRTLLEERFKLAVHLETRPGAEYSLVAAKGGPKMKKADNNSPRGSGWGPTMLRVHHEPRRDCKQAHHNPRPPRAGQLTIERPLSGRSKVGRRRSGDRPIRLHGNPGTTRPEAGTDAGTYRGAGDRSC
jgi:hypothetical protein